MGLPDTGTADEERVAVLSDEVQIEQVEDALAVDRRGVLPVEGLDGLENWEVSAAEPPLNAPIKAGGSLFGQECVEEVPMALILGSDALDLLAIAHQKTGQPEVVCIS